MNALRRSAAMRRYVAVSVVLGVVIAATAIAAAIVLAHVVAGVITDPAARTVDHWTPALAVLAALWSVRAAAQWAQTRLGQHGATAVIAETGRTLLQGVTALPPRDLQATRERAAVLLTRGLDGLRPYLVRFLPAVVLAAVVTPGAVVAMAVHDVQAAVIVVIALPLVPLFMVLIGLVTRDRSAAALTALGTLQARLLDLAAGLPTLRALGRADGAAPRIANVAAAQRRSAMATLRIAFLSSFVLELLATLGVALVAVSVGLRLVFGDIALADALTALLLAPEVFWPLRRVGAEFHAAQDGKTAATDASDLLDALPKPPRGSRRVTARGAEIRLAGLGVSGRDGDAPHDLTAVLAPGAVTVLTGPNGAGKSTVLQAILGLTPPTAGCVSVAGVDVADLAADAWFAQVAWLPQRPMLVPGTVRHNLHLLGAVEDVETACRDSGFDDVVRSLPRGWDTELGSGGVGLSLGQRQRLGLARTLGSSAPVLLLDEPTAHLDAESEARVLRALVARARAGDTVVVIGHRPEVLAVADQIVEVRGAHLVAH